MSVLDWLGNLKKTRPVLFWIFIVLIGIVLAIGAVLTAGLLIVVLVLISKSLKRDYTVLYSQDYMVRRYKKNGSIKNLQGDDVNFNLKYVYLSSGDRVEKIEYYNEEDNKENKIFTETYEYKNGEISGKKYDMIKKEIFPDRYNDIYYYKGQRAGYTYTGYTYTGAI